MVIRPVVRFAAATLAVSGALLVADAGVTLAWQEPVSALLAEREQAQLERELEARTDALRQELARPGRASDRTALLPELAGREARRLRRGQAVGRVELPTLDRAYTLVEGTDTATLRQGPAHYPETPLPGQGGTVAIAGHRTTYGAPFRPIDRLRRGQPVVVTVPYGRFVYRVERTRIVPPDAVWVKAAVGYERVILTACHPLYSGEAHRRVRPAGARRARLHR